MKFDREIYCNIMLINPETNEFRGKIDIRQLRMSFSVFKTRSWSTNKAEFNIWNLGSDKRNQLFNVGDLVSIYAGYKENGGAQLIFRGNTTDIKHSFPQPEIISTLICGDGDRSLNNIILQLSFVANTPVRSVLQTIADNMQMTIASDLPPIEEVYSNGYSDTNLAKDLLDTVCNYANIWWGVQNGNLVFQRANVPSVKPEAIISAENGMIGVPERLTEKDNTLYFTENAVGWNVKTLLSPEILPDDIVTIKSNRVDCNGRYIVQSLQHNGDTYSDSFITTLQVFQV